MIRNVYEQMLLGLGALIKAVLYGALGVGEAFCRIITNPRYMMLVVIFSIVMICLCD
jgi:hypothetical protein